MKQVILIGGPSHGEIVGMTDDMRGYREIKAQGPNGYQEHRYHEVTDGFFLHISMVYSQFNDWCDLEKQSEKRIRVDKTKVDKNHYYFEIQNKVICFMKFGYIRFGGGSFEHSQIWYNHEYAKQLGILDE